MSINKYQRIIKILLIIFVVLIFSIPINLILAQSIINWGWADNIGWISLKSQSGEFSYGVSLEPDGNLTGYAWSEHIGWIKFDPGGLYPALPEHSARVNLDTNEASGWARACTMVENKDTCEGAADERAGDWNGWISLRGTGYGVVLSANQLEGWAWADDFGWINFVGIPVREGTIILKLRGREERININPQGLIEIVR